MKRYTEDESVRTARLANRIVIAVLAAAALVAWHVVTADAGPAVAWVAQSEVTP